MKVVHVSTSDFGGGAAIAAYRLHRALLKENIDSEMLVKYKYKNENNINLVSYDNKIKKYLKLIINKIYYKLINFKYNNNKNTIFPRIKYGIDISQNNIVKNADIIHLHCIVGNYLSLKYLAKLFKDNKKIIWTLHDMWAFTGGCHYSGNCEKYKVNCGDCPILASGKENDLSRKLFNKKLEIYNTNIEIITCSNWLNECAQKSTLIKNMNITVIPNVLDDSIFKSINKDTSRELLNLNKGKKYILFGAINSTSDHRKGWEYLKKSLIKLNDYYPELKRELKLLVFGASYSEDVKKLPIEVEFLGQFYDEIALSLIYNSADLFVAPSLQDNLPNTVLESLHCGTPVVAFDIGGMPDMIKHKENGYLVDYKDINDLAYGIKWTLNNLKNVDIKYDYLKSKNIIDNILTIYNK